MKIHAVVLAAGKGTRFDGEHAKCASFFANIPMISYILHSLFLLQPMQISVVLGYKKEEMLPLLPSSIKVCYQDIPKGTADAIKQVPICLDSDYVLIIPGDSPLISLHELRKLKRITKSKKTDLTILCAKINDAASFGIVTKTKQKQYRIVEAKEREKTPHPALVNLGVYLIRTSLLLEYLPQIQPSKLTKEWYLTDLVELVSKQKKKITIVKTKHVDYLGINDKSTLHHLEEKMVKKGGVL